jgi:hypothetical protein
MNYNNFMNGIFGGTSVIGSSNGGIGSNSNVLQTSTNYLYTNGQISNSVNTAYPYPPPPSGYGYYMLNNNGQTVPYTTTNPYSYNPNMPYGQIYSPSSPIQVGKQLAVGVPPQLNGANLDLTPSSNAPSSIPLINGSPLLPTPKYYN